MNLRPVGPEAAFDLADLHDKAFDRPWTCRCPTLESVIRSPATRATAKPPLRTRSSPQSSGGTAATRKSATRAGPSYSLPNGSRASNVEPS